MILPASPCVDLTVKGHRDGWITRPIGGLATLAGMILYLGCSGPTPDELSIAGATSVVVFEGLPHATIEEQAFQAEKAGPKSTFERAGSWFYAERLVLPEAESAALRQLLGNPISYQQLTTEKKCGGFHPDYAVEWSEATATRTALLCFTCEEIKGVGPSGEHHFDLNHSTTQRLRDLLEPHRKNRPAPR